MKSILTVTYPASSYDLTTRDAVLAEMRLSGESGADDSLISSQIAQASQAIATYCNRVLVQEDVSELFWPDPNALNHRGGTRGGANFWSWRGFAGVEAEIVRLDRYPVSSIASVMLDDEVVDPSEYRLDADAGLLYRLDSSGYPWTWFVAKSLIIDYTGGYDPIPSDVDRAARLFVIDAFSGASKDPRVRSETIFGVRSVSFLAGGARSTGDLPPDVETLLAPYRRIAVS
jgi:hypothetical protein